MEYLESYKEVPERVELTPNDVVVINSKRYIIENVVGKGGFGTVYRFMDSVNTDYALKVLNLWEMLPQEYDSLMRRFKQEYQFGRIESPNIVGTHYMGFILGNPFIIMDYCPNGNLLDNLHNLKDENNYGKVAYHILCSLKALHDDGIVHRDIKPENLLFDSDYTLKLTDFGIAARLDKRLTSTSFFGKAKEAFASIVYSPPEQLDQSKYYSGTKPTMDIYSFGITMYYVMSHGQTPFGDINQYKIDPSKYINRKKTTIGTPLEYYNSYLSKEWYSIIAKCLQPNAKDRYNSVDEIIPIFEKYRNASIVTKDKNEDKPEVTSSESSEESERTSLLIFPLGFSQYSDLELESVLTEKNNRLIRIGRKSDLEINNDISFDNTERSISKRHATLEWRSGDWFIKDGQFSSENGQGLWMSSKNGTYVNRQRLIIHEEKKLIDGDIIRIGTLQIKFRKN